MAIAQGTIGFIKAFPIPAEKQHPNNYGKVNTHRLSFVLQEQEGVWYNVGESQKDHLDVKLKGNWVTLKKGDKVEFMYQPNGNYNNVKASAINVTSQAADAPATTRTTSTTAQKPVNSGTQATTTEKKPYRKASTGDLVGHSIKCVCGMGITPYASNFMDLAKQVYDITAGLKTAYATAHPELSDYEAGAPIGMAVEQLCRQGVSLQDLPEQVKFILDLQVDLKAYIDNGGNTVNFTWNDLGGAKAPDTTNTDGDDSGLNMFDGEPPMDFDDDIPF